MILKHNVNFIKRQAFHSSTGALNKTVRGKYYTDCFSATVLTLRRVATSTMHNNVMTIKLTSQQHTYVSTEQRLFCSWWLLSVCQAPSSISFCAVRLKAVLYISCCNWLCEDPDEFVFKQVFHLLQPLCYHMVAVSFLKYPHCLSYQVRFV